MPNGTHMGLVSDYDEQDRREKAKKLEQLRARLKAAEKVVEASECANNWPAANCRYCEGDGAVPVGDPEDPDWEQCRFCHERELLAEAIAAYREDYPEGDDDG